MHCFESLPLSFLERTQQVVTDDKKRNEVLQTFCKKKPITIRINTLISDKQSIIDVLHKQKIEFSEVAWYSNALVINGTPMEQLTSLPSYKNGDFYIQNLSSMIPAIVLDPKPDENILDLCAAPGSKTSQMAMMMNNTGTIIANDKSRQRLYKLQSNIKTQHVTNTEVMSYPGEILWKKFPNYFDKTIVDAPCSMEGRFNATDPETYKDWSLKKIKLLSQSQKWLLRSAITVTKPGGVVVYSTCTLSPEENEGVIDWLLNNESHPIAIEKIVLANLPYGKPILQWKKRQYDSRIENCLRILPTNTMEGFFIAKIRKLL